MGCSCASRVRKAWRAQANSTVAGERIALEEVAWDGGYDPITEGLEVGGVPLDPFLGYFSELSPEEKHEVVSEVMEEFHSMAYGAAEAAGQSTSGVQSQSQSPTRGGMSVSAPITPERAWQGMCKRRPVKVGAFTWNVGGLAENRKEGAGAGIEEQFRSSVLQVLSEGMHSVTDGGCDVIAIGLQEFISLTPLNALKVVKSSKGQRISSGKSSKKPWWPETVLQWKNLFDKALNDSRGPTGDSSHSHSSKSSYVMYGQPVYLFGMLLCIYCRTACLRHIRDFGIAEVPLSEVPLAKGAKGAIACRFTLYDRSFCFINCHLAADTKGTEDDQIKRMRMRVKQIDRCWREIKFKSNTDNYIYPARAHRAAFLFGDTNMRLTAPNGISTQEEFEKHIHSVIQGGNYEDLWHCDQLMHTVGDTPEIMSERMVTRRNSMREEGQELSLWREPVAESGEAELSGPTFPPSYRLAVPGPGYSRKRNPAWTDRVLYRSQHATPASYGTVQQEQVLDPPRNLSDHNPVFATFDVECVTMDLMKLSDLVMHVRAKADDPVEGSEYEEHQNRLRQALAFEQRVTQATRPLIEQMSQRLFDSICELGDPETITAAAHQVLAFQDECWNYMINKFEAQVHDALVTATMSRERPAGQGAGRREGSSAFAAGGRAPSSGSLDRRVLAEALREVLDGHREGAPAAAPSFMLLGDVPRVRGSLRDEAGDRRPSSPGSAATASRGGLRRESGIIASI